MSQTGGDVGHAGGELERRPENLPEQPARNLPVPYRRGEIANVIDWPELAAWVRGRGVTAFGLVMIAAQLVWKAFFLSHYFFWQDDFHFLELGLGHFGWNYLTLVDAGHWFPGVNVIVWVVARVALYNWAFATTITVIMLAAASLAALRMLRTLFGNRPAILVLLLIYLLCPLTMLDIRWWAVAVESLPLQIAMFMAVTAQVHYVRTGRFRHVIAASAWLAFGLIFFEKALVLPLLLLGITSGFLVEGPWPRAIGRCLVRYWKSWLLQALILAGYVVVFATSLHTSSVKPTVSGVGGLFSFTWYLLKNTFVPGALGGPWQWFPYADAQYASSAPPGALAWLALIVAAAVIVASIALRRYAWRAWALLAVWLVAADVAPVLLGRVMDMTPGVLALQPRYVTDAVPVLAICIGLAFLPVAGQPDARRRMVVWNGTQPAQPAQAGRLAAAGLVGAFVIGSVWSVQNLESTTSGLPTRLYLANAQAAVTEAPPGTMIVDSPVPSAVMIGAFGKYADTSEVIGPIADGAKPGRIRWTSRPDGTIDHLMIFGADGRLRQAAIYGQASAPPAIGRQCHPVTHGRVIARFPSPSYRGNQVLHVAYLAAPVAGGADMTVRYGASTQQLAIKPGLHDAYLPVSGSVSSVTISSPAIGGLCVGAVQAGIVVPSLTGLVIPAAY